MICIGHDEITFSTFFATGGTEGSGFDEEIIEKGKGRGRMLDILV